MNHLVFNQQVHPLYVIGLPFVSAQSGNSYILTDTAVSLVASGFYAVRLNNPSGSSKSIFISNVYVANTSTNVSSSLTLYRNATLSGSPTSVTPQNTNFGFSNSSVGTGQRITAPIISPISGGTVFETVNQVASLYNVSYNNTLILTPGTSLTILAQNLLGLATTINMRISYWEQ